MFAFNSETRSFLILVGSSDSCFLFSNKRSGFCSCSKYFKNFGSGISSFRFVHLKSCMTIDFRGFGDVSVLNIQKVLVTVPAFIITNLLEKF